MPLSATSAAANSAARAWMPCASFINRSMRSAIGILPQGPLRAARAAATAWSTSALPPSCTLAMTWPVAGLMSSKVRPLAEPTNSPLMKCLISFMSLFQNEM
nr:E192 [uncultured bacterium]